MEKIIQVLSMIDIGNVIAISISIISLFLSWKVHIDNDRPKVQVNLVQIDHISTNYNLVIKNISNYNLYDFKIELLDYSGLLPGKLNERLLDNTIPVFTINQVYKSYFAKISDWIKKEKIDYFTFRVSYKKKKSSKKVVIEHITFNTKTLSNTYLKKETKTFTEEF